eukprot:scaffold17457_cov105-Isochrysis_galbana.AAC.7
MCGAPDGCGLKPGREAGGVARLALPDPMCSSNAAAPGNHVVPPPPAAAAPEESRGTPIGGESGGVAGAASAKARRHAR